MFRQVQSLTYDLGPYLHYLIEFGGDAAILADSAVVKAFEEDYTNQTDAHRQVRIILNRLKIQSLLGISTVEHSAKELVQLLQNHYFKAIKLDGKPEKGERKLADDFVLLIYELLACHTC